MSPQLYVGPTQLVYKVYNKYFHYNAMYAYMYLKAYILCRHGLPNCSVLSIYGCTEAIYPSTYPSMGVLRLSTPLSIYGYLSVYLSLVLSLCPTIYPSVPLSPHLSLYLSIYGCTEAIYPSIHLWVY